MLETLQIVTVTLAALALVPALAHALELPGKMRLEKDEYLAVQTIYYPGFTIAGISEPLALIATAALLALTPRESAGFWLSFAALIGFVSMQAVYWLFTHPVNKVWLRSEDLAGAAAGFFSIASAGGASSQDWKQLRDRWEHSHVVRAGLAAASFIALVAATVVTSAS